MTTHVITIELTGLTLFWCGLLFITGVVIINLVMECLRKRTDKGE